MTQNIKFCFKIILFLRLSLQDMFHYDQNLTGSGQYVQLLIGEPAADIQTAAKLEKRTFTETKISCCRPSADDRKQNK